MNPDRNALTAKVRALIQQRLDRNKAINFQAIEHDIRTVIGQPGASYEDVVLFLKECGLHVKLGSVHEYCIPRNIRPPTPEPPPGSRSLQPAAPPGAAGEESAAGDLTVLRRRPDR